jgi:NAD(P)-dependent dehydrogenase (short-subunit alcohol dehydrogenase family)
MQTILITGANRGIGLALTRSFLQAGDNVIATCRDPAQATQLQALTSSGQLTVLPLDVSSSTSLSAFAQQLQGQTIDVLVNNAGVMGGPHQGLHDMDYEAWQHTFQVNTLAPLHLTSLLLPNLQRSTRARVVTVSSQMGAFNLNMGSTGLYAYRSSKSAVSKVMQVLAQELQPQNIIVCPVHPGWVKTDMGGANAQIEPDVSAAGLHKLINGLTLEQSGRFWTWEGKEHVW